MFAFNQEMLLARCMKQCKTSSPQVSILSETLLRNTRILLSVITISGSVVQRSAAPPIFGCRCGTHGDDVLGVKS